MEHIECLDFFFTRENNISRLSLCPWQTRSRVWVNHRWLFLSPCLGATGKAGCGCPLSSWWQRAGTVKTTERGKTMEPSRPCRFLRGAISICPSGPNLTLNTFQYFLLYSFVLIRLCTKNKTCVLPNSEQLHFCVQCMYNISPCTHSITEHYKLILFGSVMP